MSLLLLFSGSGTPPPVIPPVTSDAIKLISWLRLTAIGGTGGSAGFDLQGFDETPFDQGGTSGSATEFFYSSQENENLTSYRTKLLRPIDFEVQLPPPGRKGRGLDTQSATVSLSNIDVGDHAIAPPLSYIRSTTEVRGATASVGLYQVGIGDIVTLAGRVRAVPVLNRREATVRIDRDDSELRRLLVPTRRVRDLFPSANTDSTTAKDAPVVWPFGIMKLAELSLCMAGNYLDLVFNIAGTGTGRYHYTDLTSISDTSILSTYFLEYDVWWPSDRAFIGIDLECSDGTRLKNQAVNDQNGYATVLTTDISSKCVGTIYRRRISLASLAGKSVTKFMVGCESGTAGQWTGKIGQAVIVDSSGVIIREIITANTTSFTTAEAYYNHASNTSAHTKDNAYYFGPIKDNSDVVTVDQVYRNAGTGGGFGVVSSSEYTTPNFLGCTLVKFPVSQVDGQSKPVQILADVNTTQYDSNPASVIQDLLIDIRDGAVETVDSTTFTAANSAYDTLALTVGGGLDVQRPLGDVLDDLALHGAYLQRGTDNEIEMYVDTASLHTQASVDLEVPSTDLSLSRHLNNAEVSDDNTGGELADYISKMEARGYLRRSLSVSGQPSWLISSERTRVVENGVPLAEPLDFPYVIDPTVLDRCLHYEWEVMKAWDSQLSLDVTRIDHGVLMSLGKKVTVYCRDMSINGTTYTIHKLRVRNNQFSVGLFAYPTDAYTYSAGTNIKIDSKATIATDYSYTLPSAPASLTVTGTGVRTSTTTGQIEAYFSLSAPAPSANVTHLIFELRPQDGLVAAFTSAPIPVTPGATGTGEVVGIPGRIYDLYVRAHNATNVPGYRDGSYASQLDQTAALNTTPPAAPVIASLRQGTGLTMAGEITPNSESDIEAYELYLGLTDDINDASKIGEVNHGTKVSFVYANFTTAQLGQQLYLLAKARNTSKTLSVASTAMPIRVDLVDTDGIKDEAVSSAGSTGSASIAVPNATGRVFVQALIYSHNTGVTGRQGTFFIKKNSNSGPTIHSSGTIIQVPGQGTLQYILEGYDLTPDPTSQTYVVGKTGSVMIDSQLLLYRIEKK